MAIPLLVIGVGVAIAAYFIGSRPEAKPREAAQFAHPVSVVLARPGTVTPSIDNFGEVVASREAELRAMVAGRLVFIAEQLQDGAVISAGTKVAEIDPFEYELALQQARANFAEAEARLAELQSDLSAERKLLALSQEQIKLRQRDRDRSADLLKKGQTSKKALDDANIALNAALESTEQRRQSVARTTAKIAQQKAALQRLDALVSQAQRNLEDTVVIAPFSGYLTDTGVALGKRLAVGESLGRLISSDDLQVRFQLNNDDYARLISQGKSDALFSREVQVAWRLGDKILDYTGRIERRAAEIDPASGGVEVFARVNDVNAVAQPDDALRPGAFVKISLADISYPNVVTLPEQALVDGARVFVVAGDTLQSVPAELVRRIDDQILVRANIPADVPIVTTPFPTIGPGVKVRVVDN
ncbi:MAG: efflux RND transporter periplasmic adaptor subunit [Gammaproteobacteria bacterium]